MLASNLFDDTIVICCGSRTPNSPDADHGRFGLSLLHHVRLPRLDDSCSCRHSAVYFSSGRQGASKIAKPFVFRVQLVSKFAHMLSRVLDEVKTNLAAVGRVKTIILTNPKHL
jgi:hypothetical protein